jgi:hypothetical protein
MTQREYDDPIDALKAELAGVSPSPEFQSRVRQRIAGELDLLREELAAVAPSPEFAVRVRQGIDAAAETRKTSWLSGWRWIVPAGAVAAGVIAVIALTRSGADAPERMTVQVPIQAPATIDAPKPIVAPQAPTPTSKVLVPGATSARAATSSPVVANAVASADPMLEVITNQPAILRAMWKRMAPESVSFATPPTEEAREITIAPVEVSPIVVKWMVEPLPTPGVLPIIRRIAADRAERSSK